MSLRTWGFGLLLFSVASPALGDQIWTDATGQYTTLARLVDYDGANVVLKKTTGKVISLPLEKLSTNNQEFLRTQAAFMVAPQQPSNGAHQWALRDGETIFGRVLDFGRTRMVIQRQLGRILVNGRLYRDLSDAQQLVVRQVIDSYEHTNLATDAALERWAKRQGGATREFPCHGVIFELTNGEKFAIPLSLFSPEVEQYLKPGWEQWLAQEKVLQAESLAKEASQSQALLAAHIKARDYQRDQLMRQLVELNAIQAGLISQWEVQLYPLWGNSNPPMQVFVPARTSAGAKYEVATRYPGYFIGPVAKISRQWW